MRVIFIPHNKLRKIVIFVSASLMVFIMYTLLFHSDYQAIKAENVYMYIMNKTLPMLQNDTAETVSISSREYAWPAYGTITSRFGMRNHTAHEGIDIAAPYGTPVCAYMDGIVVFNGWESGYGYLVILDHGKGITTFYGHNSKLLVKKGNIVSMGDKIAEVGSTGDSTGPHVHFEIRIDGVPVNPLDYLE